MSSITDAAGAVLTDDRGRPLIDESEEARPASADYAYAGLALLPEGRAWAKERGSVLSRLVAYLTPTFSRIADRGKYLIRNAPPNDSLLEMLPEWESSLGLPDACSGPDATVALRQAHVRAKLTARGGQSIPYFVGVAAALGYTITIEEFAPARAGMLRAGQSLYGRDWQNTWRVHAPAITINYFRAGASRAGEPLQAYGNLVLVCTLNRIAPADKILIFAFGS